MIFSTPLRWITVSNKQAKGNRSISSEWSQKPEAALVLNAFSMEVWNRLKRESWGSISDLPEGWWILRWTTWDNSEKLFLRPWGDIPIWGVYFGNWVAQTLSSEWFENQRALTPLFSDMVSSHSQHPREELTQIQFRDNLCNEYLRPFWWFRLDHWKIKLLVS